MKFSEGQSVPMDSRYVVWADAWPASQEEWALAKQTAEVLAEIIRYCTVIVIAVNPKSNLPDCIAEGRHS